MNAKLLMNALETETCPLSYLTLDGSAQITELLRVYIVITDFMGQSFAAIKICEAGGPSDCYDYVQSAAFCVSAEDNSAESMASEACKVLGLERSEWALRLSDGEPLVRVWQSDADDGKI